MNYISYDYHIISYVYLDVKFSMKGVAYINATDGMCHLITIIRKTVWPCPKFERWGCGSGKSFQSGVGYDDRRISVWVGGYDLLIKGLAITFNWDHKRVRLFKKADWEGKATFHKEGEHFRGRRRVTLKVKPKGTAYVNRSTRQANTK